MSLVAKESILVEKLLQKLKNNMPAHFFCPILYIINYKVGVSTFSNERDLPLIHNP